MRLEIHLATPAEATVVAEMAVALTEEIVQRTGTRHFNVSLEDTATLCERFIAAGSYAALIATEDSRPLGFAGVCESHALYTEGTFGIIQEFYVAPASRSAGVGAALLEAACNHARARGWKRLELCTPPLPEFQSSLAFYERHGFDVTGGRKMKYITWLP
jgi:GNAT superfamily N-acetyltransferase